MPDDYRVEVGFFDHPKTVKVERLCGPAGPVCFLRLIEFCAKNPSRATGDLAGMDDDDIEIAAKWRGEPGVLIGALRRYKFIDEGSSQIHEFEEHQPWIAGTVERSESGRIASLVRWHKAGKHAAMRKGCPLCYPHSGCNADASKIATDRIDLDAVRSDPQCPGSDPDSDPDSDPGKVRIAPVLLGPPPLNPWAPGEPIETAGDFLDATQEFSVGDSAPATLNALLDAGPIQPHELDPVLTKARKKRAGLAYIVSALIGRRNDAAKVSCAPPIIDEAEAEYQAYRDSLADEDDDEA